MVVSKEDIVAYKLEGGRLVCEDCVGDDAPDPLTAECIVTREEVEKSDDLYFCDECKEQIA